MLEALAPPPSMDTRVHKHMSNLQKKVSCLLCKLTWELIFSIAKT